MCLSVDTFPDASRLRPRDMQEAAHKTHIVWRMRLRVRVRSKWWKKVVRGGVGSCNRLRAIKLCTGRSPDGFSRPEEVVRPKKEREGRRRCRGRLMDAKTTKKGTHSLHRHQIKGVGQEVRGQDGR